MASSTIAETAPSLATMEAKMIVATGRDHCQQLKDMVSKEDPSSMLVVMAICTPDSPPRSRTPVMDPGLLAVACSGSWKKLQSFLNGDPRSTSSDLTIRWCCCFWQKLQSFLIGDPRPTSIDRTIRCCWCLWKKRQSFPPAEPLPTSSVDDGPIGSSAIQQPSRDQEALVQESFLDGVTIEGDTFLHVMATNSVGEDLIEDSIGLIHRKAVQFLSRQNNNGDTPLHCATRAAKSQMVSFLIDLARANNTVKALLEKQNHSHWTALHEAVRVGNNDIVKLLMTEDPELASVPNVDTSPMYLAILQENKIIVETLHRESGGVLSYSGPNGQNALHAAVLRGKDLTKMLLGWNNTLTIQQDENGSTPLHLAVSVPVRRDLTRVRRLLLEANLDQLYQPDKDGLFPIHVAASVGATFAISDFLKKSASCAGLRDARGRTFLHVAVEKMEASIVSFACTNQSLSWILNMQDIDGNTVLHLAVRKGSLSMFCALFGNRKVQLNLTNKEGETPLDIARRNVEEQAVLNFNQNSEEKIYKVLTGVGAKWGICRHDYLKTDEIVQARQDKKRILNIVKETTQTLCIGSALIATVTFGATFTMPGGYRADDHTNGGTPTLAGRYAFDSFIVANALAFVFSAMATISLMYSGSPMIRTESRVTHLATAYILMQISVTSLVAAFAFGTYMMLAPVAHKAAVTVCVLSSLVLLYGNLEAAFKSAMVTPAIFCRRLGIPHKIELIFPLSVLQFVVALLANLWPVVLIFGLNALSYTGHKVEPAAQPPKPFA